MSDQTNGWFSTHDERLGDRPSTWGRAIWLRLQRYADSVDDDLPPGPPVLLLHGGSANFRTFTVPGVGLARWLLDTGYDPWLLDWRGSGDVAGHRDNRDTLRDPSDSDLYTFNQAALEDLPAAIAMMRWRGVREPIAAVGHCMGSAVIAEAIALGHTQEIDRIVLLSLGLFYEAPIDSRLKSEERILERLTREVADVPCIDPVLNDDGTLRNPWPTELNNLYDAWPESLRAHEESTDPAGGLCNRLSFMYGMPYREENLAPGIHTSASGDAQGGANVAGLADQFGGFPLKMYLHAARNLRHGRATFFKEDFLGTEQAASRPDIVSDKARERFHALTKLTLITGALNRLWHRDSIDRMHEWLCRGSSRNLSKMRKHVLPDFAHQDLLWSPSSPTRVYPLIATGLGLNSVESPPSS